MSINTISPQSGVLTFIKAASRSAQLWSTALSNTRADQENPLLTLLAKSDPDKAAALRQEQRQAQELLQRLKSSKKDINEQRKAAAREKVERLKAQIQVLLMMSSGDPEAVARQAAHLARELSAAAKQYASAGGSAGLVGDVTGNLLTTGAATATPTPAEPVLGGAGTNTISVTGTNGRDADAQTLSSRDEQKAVFLKIGSDLNSKTAEQNAAREEDQKFIQTVRNLVSALHAIINKAEQEIRREDGTSSDRDVTHVDKALRDTEQALQNISAVAFSAPTSINTAVSLTV